MTALRFSITFLLIHFWSQSFGQATIDSCELNLRLNSNLKANIYALTKSEYTRLRNIYFKNETKDTTQLNSDSLEKATVDKFPAIFSSKDSCYSFNSVNGKKLKASKYQGADLKNYSTFKFVGTNCDIVQINIEQYESWRNLYVNTTTGKAFETTGDPIYLDCDYLYSKYNTFRNTEISIVNLKNMQNMTLIYEGWNVEESFTFQTYFIFKMKSTFCANEIKYLNIQLN